MHLGRKIGFLALSYSSAISNVETERKSPATTGLRAKSRVVGTDRRRQLLYRQTEKNERKKGKGLGAVFSFLCDRWLQPENRRKSNAANPAATYRLIHSSSDARGGEFSMHFMDPSCILYTPHIIRCMRPFVRPLVKRQLWG